MMHAISIRQLVQDKVSELDSKIAKLQGEIESPDSSPTRAVQQCCHWPLFLQQHTTLTTAQHVCTPGTRMHNAQSMQRLTSS